MPPYSIAAETWPLGNDDSRIDLAIEGAQFIIVIELKIDAREGIDQIEKYMNILRAGEKQASQGKDIRFHLFKPPCSVKPSRRCGARDVGGYSVSCTAGRASTAHFC